MNREEMLRIGGLFEELGNIVRSSSVGSGTEPVWDGTLIGKHRKKPLVEMGLIEYSHGYWFPTKTGLMLFRAFVKENYEAMATGQESEE